jgi:hypothetical protein
MMLDTRFNSTDRAVLTALALHYNLKTGACFPAIGRVALEAGLGENGDRTARRALTKAAKLGWVKRTSRCGGPREKNQTNLYELTRPKQICDALANVGPSLAVTGTPGAWQVTQTTDGMAICGPFEDRANAEQWVAAHGPTGQIAQPTGQNRGADRTIEPPMTGKLQ